MSEDSVKNKVNEYYKLKSRYEEENQKNKNKIRNNKELILKEKKQEFQQLLSVCQLIPILIILNYQRNNYYI